MKMEDPRVSERNRCDAHEILATPCLDHKAVEAGNTEIAESTGEKVACRQEAVEKSFSLSSDDNTRLRLDTVINMKSDMSEHAIMEEKKDDDDATPPPTAEEAARDTVGNLEKHVATLTTVGNLEKYAPTLTEINHVVTPEQLVGEDHTSHQQDEEDAKTSESKRDVEATKESAESKVIMETTEVAVTTTEEAGDVGRDESAKDAGPTEMAATKANGCHEDLSMKVKKQSAKVEDVKEELPEPPENLATEANECQHEGSMEVKKTSPTVEEAKTEEMEDRDGRPDGAAEVLGFSTESVDSDKPIGEPDVTTRQTESVDSDTPMSAPVITASSIPISEVMAEKATKTVQFAEDTILTKDGGIKIDTKKPTKPTAENVGYFSCASLCGSVFDAADEADQETESLKLKIEVSSPDTSPVLVSNNDPPLTLKQPVLAAEVENQSKDLVDTGANDEVTLSVRTDRSGHLETAMQSEAETASVEDPVASSEGKPGAKPEGAQTTKEVVEGDTIVADVEKKIEDNNTVVDEVQQEEAQSDFERHEPNGSVQDSEPNAVLDKAATGATEEASSPNEPKPVVVNSSDHEASNTIVEDSQHAIGLQSSSTFEIQQGRGCTALFMCSVLPSPGIVPSPKTITSSSSHDPIFDIREAAERELDERTAQEARLAAESVVTADREMHGESSEHRVSPNVQIETICNNSPKGRSTVQEESAPKVKNNGDLKPDAKGPADDEKEPPTTIESPTNQKSTPTPHESSQCNGQPVAAISSPAEQVEPQNLTATITPAADVGSTTEPTPESKQASTLPQETTEVPMPAPSRDVLVVGEDEIAARKAQQEAYACGCAIL